MSTGIKLNSTVPTYFYADTVKGVIILSPDGMVKTAAGLTDAQIKNGAGLYFSVTEGKTGPQARQAVFPHCGYERKKRDIHAGCCS